MVPAEDAGIAVDATLFALELTAGLVDTAAAETGHTVYLILVFNFPCVKVNHKIIPCTEQWWT